MIKYFQDKLKAPTEPLIYDFVRSRNEQNKTELLNSFCAEHNFANILNDCNALLAAGSGFFIDVIPDLHGHKTFIISRDIQSSLYDPVYTDFMSLANLERCALFSNIVPASGREQEAIENIR
ncbi:MAG: hypothetical protein AAB649_03700, partial [Patescibacteria group bacterium]